MGRMSDCGKAGAGEVDTEPAIVVLTYHIDVQYVLLTAQERKQQTRIDFQ